MNEAIPTFSERYRLLGPLGRGGMGVVWRAHDETLNREVAVKQVVLPPGLGAADRRTARERALREARAAAVLRHPGIVAVHDVVPGEDGPWIVMELISGRSLDEEIGRHGPLPPQRVAGIGLAVLGALGAAHAQGVLHRDVKPANIMLADGGRVVLTDFGIASLAGDPSLTSTGTLIGSPGFIAPERLRERVPGPESDIWSLGATLYAAVEGRAPFERETPMATLGAVLTESPPPARRAGPLEALLLRMLDKDPVRRLPAEAVDQALRRVVAGEPTRLTVPAVRPEGRRRRILLAVGAAAAVAVVAATAVTVTLAGGSDRPHGRVTAPASAGGPVARTSAARLLGTVDYCDLLSPSQAVSLVAGARRTSEAVPGGPARCAWVGKARHEVLELGAPSGRRPAGTVAEAHEDFAGVRNRDLSRADPGGLRCPVKWSRPDAGIGDDCARQTPIRDLRGVGEEAFAFELAGDPGSPVQATVVLRVSNALVAVTFMSPSGGRPARTQVLTAAGQVARTLARKAGGG